jgi:hypothetical protein
VLSSAKEVWPSGVTSLDHSFSSASEDVEEEVRDCTLLLYFYSLNTGLQLIPDAFRLSTLLGKVLADAG